METPDLEQAALFLKPHPEEVCGRAKAGHAAGAKVDRR